MLLAISVFIALSIPPAEPPPFTPPPPTATLTPLPLILPTTPAPPTATATNVPPTPQPNEIIYTIQSRVNGTGWVQSDEVTGNHFGESYIYAGLREGVTYHGAIQFVLTGIPEGASVLGAELILTGALDEGLQPANIFILNVMPAELDRRWSLVDYNTIHNTAPEPIEPILLPAINLSSGKENRIEFSAAVRGLIENRLRTGAVSFRLDTLFANEEGWFAWDSGFGEQSLGNRPVLRLNVSQPNTVLPEDAAEVDVTDFEEELVIVTSTPTPENRLTAVVADLTATHEAEIFGPSTPLPPFWVTPFVLLNTPTPDNAATAFVQAAEATLLATVYGTPTAPPLNAATATATPTFFVITNTPTPQNALTAVIQREQFANTVTTPFPDNWVTPLIVTSTPSPVNQATAAYRQAQFLTTGTPTPLPANAQTATSTPVFVVLQGELPAWTATPTPTFTPGPIPAELFGKIGFKSDRGIQRTFTNPATGAREVIFDESAPAEIYVINPDGTGLALLSDRWPYDLARAADGYSIDGRFRVFTKDFIRYINIDGEIEVTVIDEQTGEESIEIEEGVIDIEREDVPALFWYDAHYNVEEQLTFFGAGIAYGGVWSPTREQIAFVSNDSGNDEIWVVNRDGSELRQITRDPYSWWDKDPSWSPDGEQIVFWSNRTGHGQIWIMNRDGSNLYSISRTGFNDWDPVWFKYPGIPVYTPPE